MSDPAERFRSILSNQLRTALAARDGEAVRILRCVMAAIDNAGAVLLADIAHAAPRTTETTRRRLSEQEITDVL